MKQTGNDWLVANTKSLSMRLVARLFSGLMLAAIAVPVTAVAQTPSAPRSESSTEAKLSAAAVREDLEQLYSTLKEAHYDLYARRSSAQYDRFYRQLTSSITGPLSKLEATKRFQELLAYGRVGHASTSALYELASAHRANGGRFVPLFVQVEGTRFLLAETADANAVLRAGDELLAISNKPLKSWQAKLRRFVSADTEYLAAAQMENAFPVLLWLELGDVVSLNVRARQKSGKIVQVQVPALTRAELVELRKQHPTAELATDFSSREVRLMDARVAYLRPGPFFNTEEQAGDTGLSYEDSKYRRFLDDAFAQIVDSSATDLLIDLRHNPGGDNSFSDPMVAWFANRPFRFANDFVLKASAATKAHYERLRENGTKEEGTIGDLMRAEANRANGERYPFPIAMVNPRTDRRFNGRVFVLQNRHSYSNAASVAALIQDYGFGKILGEETADLASTFGSSVTFKLRNSGVNVSYPKSRITRINGDTRARGVVPDIHIAAPPPGVSDDVVLAKAIDLIKRSRDAKP
jgi:Peptidase family S41